jgi:hypothetical protein
MIGDWTGKGILLERLEVFARLEPHGFPGWDVHLGARARVSADAGFAGLHVENTKATQLDAVALGQGLLHGFENSLHRNFRPGFGNAGASYDLRDDVQLNHANLLKTGTLIVEKGLIVVKTFLLYYYARLFPGDGGAVGWSVHRDSDFNCKRGGVNVRKE